MTKKGVFINISDDVTYYDTLWQFIQFTYKSLIKSLSDKLKTKYRIIL